LNRLDSGQDSLLEPGGELGLLDGETPDLLLGHQRQFGSRRLARDEGPVLGQLVLGLLESIPRLDESAEPGVLPGQLLSALRLGKGVRRAQQRLDLGEALPESGDEGMEIHGVAGGWRRTGGLQKANRPPTG